MESLQFKNYATRFRKNAKKLGLGFPLTTLLDIYAYAHYGRPYCVVHSMANRCDLPAPAFPPYYLEMTAARFGVAPALILECMDFELNRASPPPLLISAEEFRERVQRFRQVAPSQGIKLKMTTANDLFSRAYFARAYAPVVAALRAGKPLSWPYRPEFLGAACVLYGVDPRKVLAALVLAAEASVRT